MSIIFQADKAQGINAYYWAQRFNTDGSKRRRRKKKTKTRWKGVENWSKSITICFD